MSDYVENKFIEHCVVKNKRDRLRFEWNGKKRVNGILRFCHHADELLIKEKIIAHGTHLYYDEIVKTIKKYGVSGEWHIIAFHRTIDRMSCTLNEALDLVLGNGMAAIIVSDTMAIVETEQCAGTPERYILHH